MAVAPFLPGREQGRTPLSNLRTALDAKLSALTAHIWPSGKPSGYTFATGGSPTWTTDSSNWPELDGWWAMTFDTGHGFTAAMRLLVPKVALYPHVGQCIFLRSGHDGASWNGPYTAIAKLFATHGYHVVTSSMLFHGDNPASVDATVPGTGTVTMDEHNDLDAFDGSGVSGISKFMDDVISCLNWLDAVHDFDRYHIAGLSGGGTDSSFIPAVESRFTCCWPVAGWMYQGLWGSTPDYSVDNTGEYEQHTGPWNAIASVDDIFALAAYNRPAGGFHRLTCNKFDYYNSSYGRYAEIEAATRAVQARLGYGQLGQHSWFEDASHGTVPRDPQEHKISAQTQAQIMADLAALNGT